MSKTLHRLVRVEDVVWAVLLFIVLDGFSVGTSDDVAFLPWLAKWADPTLYPGDPRFSSWPISYYALHLFYLRALATIMPIIAGLVLSIAASWVLLVCALRNIAESLTGHRVPSLLFAILLTGYFNSHLAGGYYLYSSGFSTHYLAFPLILFGVGLLLRGRGGVALMLVIPAAAVNPRVGAFGAVVMALTWIWMQPEPRRTRLLISAGAVGVILAGIFSALIPASMGGLTLNEIVRVWAYIRAPWHYAPASWSEFVFLNFGLAVIVLVLLRPLCTEERMRTVWFVSATCMALTAAGIVNNGLMIVPAFVLANPFEFGPLALALFYVLIAVVVVNRMAVGWMISTLLILVVPDLQTRLLLLIAVLAFDRYRRLPDSKDAHTWIMPGERSLLLVQLGIVFVSLAIIGDGWRQVDYRSVLMRFPPLAAASVLVACWCAPALARFAVFARAAVFGVIASMEAMRSNPDPVRNEVTAEMRDLCGFVSSHTPKEAVFVTPSDTPAFQFYCRRASYFEFAQLPLDLRRIPEWIRRLKRIGLVSADLEFARLNGPVEMDYSAYRRFDAASFGAIAKDDPRIAYVLVRRPQALALPLRYENDGYRLYALPKPHS